MTRGKGWVLKTYSDEMGMPLTEVYAADGEADFLFIDMSEKHKVAADGFDTIVIV